MQPAHWTTVKDLLNESLLIAPPLRAEFVNRANVDDYIVAEVMSLLALEADSADFMSVTLSEFSKDFVAESAALPKGQRVGIYEITDELGYGGMGAVYLAERRDGKLEQKVALKMLRREYNVDKFRHRFSREREIHSKVEHPNIVRLLDAGTSSDGIPYLVMEHVDGLPIDRYCRKLGLDLTARLKLFSRVCDAVAFAHRNLIVHRDLKPSNILVTYDGIPKLLDFGISKMLDPSQDPRNTVTNLVAMTPAYASPEQVLGRSITTATDVYSLGAILYKLVAGRAPFEGTGDATDFVKRIAEQDPLPPSRVAPSGGISSASLRGDIDNIVLKALNKAPEDRYLTVQQLRGDIWRHIDGHPITAGPPTFAYRLSKYLMRYKLAAIMAVIVLVSLVGGASFALWQASEARGQAILASNEAKRSDKISQFMFQVLGHANPRWYAAGSAQKGQAKVIEVMLEMGDEIDQEFPNDPDIAAELHHRFTEVFLTTGHSDQALAHARRAYDLRRQYYGSKHELVAKDMYYLIHARGVAPDSRADFMAEALQIMRETNPDNLNYAYIIEDYVSKMMLPKNEKWHASHIAAINTTEKDRYRVAEQLIIEADRTFRLHYGEEGRAVIANRCRLAFVLIVQGRLAEAAPHEQICREFVGPNRLSPRNAEIVDAAYGVLAQSASEDR